MDEKRLVTVSKFLSRHLRHEPERLGLALGPGGWVEVDDLLAGCARRGFPVSREELEAVVRGNDKKRFALTDGGTRIRASQGHSVPVELGLEPLTPPAVLYHGTGHGSAEAVAREGLRRMERHHVHLSIEPDTARRVGARHGRPVVFAVDAAGLHDAGVTFYRSDNGVWLVDAVPPDFLSRLEG